MNSGARPWVVLKFGGTSVATAGCWQTIASIVRKRNEEGFRCLLVCSALAGISNDLDRLAASAVEGRHHEILKDIESRHRSLATELGVEVEGLDALFAELESLSTGASLVKEASPRLRAQIMAVGELASTRIGAAYLNKIGIAALWRDAREDLVSDETRVRSERHRYLAASCDTERDPSLIKRYDEMPQSVIVTQGFIARNPEGHTVLLGRGGSDVSAAYFAARIGASRCEIWTDVPGMYTANPRKVPQARLLRSLDYDEAQEIASSGAKVLHPRTVAPVRRHSIPLHIFSVAHPDAEGTVISADASGAGDTIKAISSRNGITLVSMDTIEMWQQVGFLADVFNCFKRHGLSIDLISTSESNITVTLDRAANAMDKEKREALLAELQEFCSVRIIDSCAFVSLVGKNIRSIWHRLGSALEVFEEQRVYMVSQAANDLNLTFVVDDDQAERLVQDLHAQLFRSRGSEELFGQSWAELNSRDKVRARSTPWWRGRRDELCAIAQRDTPIYVYDGVTMGKRLNELKKMKSVDRWFYSIKANRNPQALAMVHDAGFGFECVSPGEIAHVIELFPHIDRTRILFTPNFAGGAEYEYGFKQGALVTLDNIYPLTAWPKIFKGRELFVRIDPGEGKGHHKYVHTAGAKSKFGVWPSQLGELEKLLGSCGATVVGLHAHVGSNIFASDTWSKNALFLAAIAERFPHVRTLDLGGGLGVVERPGQEPLDIALVDSHLSEFRKAQPKYQLWMEPGRYVVAEAGVLLVRATQTKEKGEYKYIGVDGGMNMLIRPALYGAYHEIVNLTRVDEPAQETATIVGPICESGDILGYERRMPKTRDGDVLLVATTGAYGHVMSSTYNLRGPAKEHFLD